MPASYCTGKEFVAHSAITLLLMRTLDADSDEPAWTAYYYKTSLSGELVGTVFAVYGAGQPQFMSVGGNDDRIQGEWENEKKFWLSDRP